MRKRLTKVFAGAMAMALMLGSGITFPGSKADTVHAGVFTEGDPEPVVEITKANFPDDNFRAVISSADYDRNLDGIIDEDENIYLRNIWCNNCGIRSLKGIEYFTELRGLYCMDNKIKTMDLSNNKLLTGVWCSGNLFTSLDFTANPDLEWVYCFDCKLKSFNIRNNPKISYVEINSNPLTELDVTQNPLLEHLTCGDCGLKELDLSNNPNLQHLDAMRNKFTKLDVTGCPKMKRLDVWDNHELGSIDVTKCPGLTYYNCANNGATKVDVSKNPQLQKLICSYNKEKLTELDVTNNPKLLYLDCACNGIKNLDLSKNKSLYYLMAFTNPLTTLDISHNPFLVQCYREGVKADESAICKGHSWTLDYGGDTSTGGDNIYLLVFDDATKLVIDNKVADELLNEKDRPGDEENLPAENQRITREMLVQTLYEMAGKPDVSGLKSRFTDVKADAWYYDALLWGEKNAICMGYPYVSSPTFGVGKCLQRQDMAFMLMRYAEYMKYERAIDFGRTDEYIDYYDIDYYAWEALTWAVTWNIMEGKGDPGAPKSQQRIDPHGKVTRDELILTIKNMWEVNHVPQTSIPIPAYVAPEENETRDKDDISSDNQIKIKEFEQLIKKGEDNQDIKGSTFSILKAKGTSKSKKNVKLSWDNVPGANQYIIYGNKCGKKLKYKKIATVTGNSYTVKKLKKGTHYKYIVVAVRNGNVLAASKTIHVTTSGKTGNYTKVKLNKSKVKLSLGKSKKIKATLKSGKKKVKIHRRLAWESDNIKVATVKKGKIKAVGKGTCYVYAYTQNGVYAKVKVTVK